LKILMEAPNLLVLDEPTNDLDIKTLTILEDYLKGFPGIIVAVSHDRYFLDKIATRIFAFEGNGKIRQYEGNFSDYKESVRRAEEETLSAEKSQKPQVPPPAKNSWRAPNTTLKFSFKEQKEYETIDDEIAALEEKISNLDTQIEENASNYSCLTELSEQKQAAESALEEKMERWMYLNDLAEKIQAQKNK
ncbi:MAG: ABC transporter ATP-binding protein, partial [Lachnospiraceae bacterium]|nr:ABC transporter ATP-binding protein [Lachnospiraceae bacterium]